ncbi:MAG: DUF4124 domain-containing protein [Woeseiaceae bacterium]|nr:DUF4124 domain-containing protein [Woeseiaceae bacterium]
MDKRAIFALFSLLLASGALAQAYRWVDENGVVHYSDRPQEGAEQIILPRANTTTVRPYNSSRAGSQDGSGADDAAGEQPSQPFRYESLEIASPSAEETLWNIEGTLNVSLNVQPGLQPGHRVRVYFDGEARDVSGTSFTIDEVWRGVHNIQAEIVDDTGRLMIRSRPNRFYVQQNTVNF